MAGRLRAAVHGIVLGSGDDAEILRIVALHACNIGHAHARGQKRVFAVGFLTSSPAGITKDVDVGRPKVQARHEVVFPSAHRLYMLDASLGADDHRHLVDGRHIKGGGQANGLRKLRGAVVQHAVQRLAPPVVSRDVEARNGPGLVHQLGGLLFKRHPAHKVGSLLCREAGVQVGRLREILRSGHPRRAAARQPCHYNPQSKAVHRIPHGRAGTLHALYRRKSLLCPPDANPNAAGKGLSSRTQCAVYLIKNRFISIRCLQRQ